MPSAIDPLSLDNKFRQRDLLNEDIEALSQSIGQIRDTCSAQCNTALSECTEHLTAIIDAYRAYYLNPGPGRWHSNLHAYHEDLQAMFDQDSSFTLEDIQARAMQELRQHTKQELCTPNSSDPKPVAENKLTTSHMLDDGVPLDDCVNEYLNGLCQQSLDEETGRFLYDLQTTSSWEERTQLYIRHYCTPLATDSPKVVNFKAKYARYFQEGGSHDKVIAAMKSEAEGSKYAAVRGLQKELEILQMGKSAHLKSQARKAEKDQKMKDTSPAVEPETATCSFSGCDQKVTLEDEDFGGPVECALCDWLSQKVEKSPRTFYCSKEHAEQDFAYHDRQRHTCISGNSCYYYPFPPPQDGITAGGLCPDCISQNQISYFCSQFCFRKNVSTHRASSRCGDGFDYRASLEMFEPSPEMVLEANV